MALTVLQMVNRAQVELGLPQSQTVFTSGADVTGAQMGALANRVLDELRQMNRWTAMQNEYDLIVEVPTNTTGNMVAESAVITNIPDTSGLTAEFFQVSGDGIPAAARLKSVDSLTQVTMFMENSNTEDVTGTAIQFQRDTYPIPSDFDYYNNRTMWDRTNRWELLGPDSPQLDQWHRSGIVVTGPRRHFRQIGALSSVFRIWPAPAEIVAPLQLVFEYLSLNAVRVSGGNTTAQYFANDTDTCILNENAMINGIKWTFWEAKGFGSYVTMQTRWVDYVKRLAARDGAAPTLTMARPEDRYLLSGNQIQDGFWPGNTGSNMT